MSDETMSEVSDEEMGCTPIPVKEEAIVRTAEDILEYLQKKNPNVVPFEYEGRQSVWFYDLYMIVCNKSRDTARKAKSRLCQNHPELCERLIRSKKEGKHFLPVISLEGAIELLLTVKSELQGCMIKMVAKDSVDVMAGTSKMAARIQKNSADPQREGLRNSCNIRDANGEGHAVIGGDVPMADVVGRVESADEIMQKNMMEIWKESGPEYYRMMMGEEWKLKKLLKLKSLKESETNQATRNVLEEKYFQECRSYTYPSLLVEDHPEADYKTVDEMIHERGDGKALEQYANAIGVKMADEYKKNHSGQPPPKRDIPGKIKPNKYLEQDRKHLDYFIDEAKREAAAKVVKLPKGQQTLMQHLKSQQHRVLDADVNI